MRRRGLPRRRYSMPETVMRRYRLKMGLDSSGSSGRRRAVGSQTTDSWRSSLATPSPRALSSSAVTSDCQTVSDKTTSTQDSTLSVPSTNSEGYFRNVTEDVETQVSLPERIDKRTSITGLKRGYSVVELAVNVEADLSDGEIREEERRSVALQSEDLNRFKVPEISVIKGSTETQVSICQTKEESSQVCRKEILQETDPLGYHIRKMKTEVACAGANYDDFPLEKPVVPRYSAYPRTNSMMVNTSSVDLTSDSELSLTDSLEDPDDFRLVPCRRSRHDERPVRGEVTVQEERRRLPKSRDAYAYFLSLTGEQDTIRGYVVPDWLRERLRRREEEIKKIYEDKYSRHQQCAYFRRRKKTVKKLKQKTPYSSSEKIQKNEVLISNIHQRNEKTVHFDNYAKNNINNNNVNKGPEEKCAVRVLNGNNMGVEPKINNIHRSNNMRNNNNHNSVINSQNDDNYSQSHLQTENVTRDSNYGVQISEVIRIDMTDSTRTVITKEKQINLPTDGKIQQVGHEKSHNELTNTTKIISTQGNNSNTKTELVDTNILSSSRESNNISRKSEIKTQNEQTSHKGQTSEKLKESTLSNTSEEPSTSKFKKISQEIVKDGEKSSNIGLDRKIADILISALEENTKAHRQCGKSSIKNLPQNTTEATIESFSKIHVRQESGAPLEEEPESQIPRTSTTEVQTDDIDDSTSDRSEDKNISDKSCITEPYLVSVRIQTTNGYGEYQEDIDGFSEFRNYEDEDDQRDNIEDSIPSGTSNNKMVDKACNTFEYTSKATQTAESILQSGGILNSSKMKQSSKKKDVQFPPQVIKQIITGTGEYKTVEETNIKAKDKTKAGGRRGKTSKGVNTDELSIIDNDVEIMSNRGHPTPFCKNTFQSKSQQSKSQVLELNVPTCTCHMCTLQKISPRGETSKVRQIQSKKDERQISKSAAKRTKFQTFDVILEERSSQNSTLDDDKEEDSRQEKSVLTEPHLVDQVIQVGTQITSVATNTDPEKREDERGTQTTNGRREGAVQTERTMEATAQTERTMEALVQTERTMEAVVQTERTLEGTTQTDERRVEVVQAERHRKSKLVIGRFRSEKEECPVRQYKGRASLSTEGQEELLTLSRGWINFYLLKDNFDLSDSNDDCPSSHRRKTEKVEEFRVEIQATPEQKSSLLPNLRQKSGGGGGQRTPGGLPEIPGGRSGSGSPGDQVHQPKGSRVAPLPGVRKTKRVDVKREAVLTERLAHQPQQTSRSVEVACSEQSISSVTSTLITSDSPAPDEEKQPVERRPRRAQRSVQLNNGSSWTVTVAGSSGTGNDPPPDVEMKLSFANHLKKPEDSLYQSQVARPKRRAARDIQK